MEELETGHQSAYLFPFLEWMLTSNIFISKLKGFDLLVFYLRVTHLFPFRTEK